MEARNDLKDSKDREDLLNQDIHSINELLKETQSKLADSREKIHQLNVCLNGFQFNIFEPEPLKSKFRFSDLSTQIQRFEKGSRSFIGKY